MNRKRKCKSERRTKTKIHHIHASSSTAIHSSNRFLFATYGGNSLKNSQLLFGVFGGGF